MSYVIIWLYAVTFCLIVLHELFLIYKRTNNIYWLAVNFLFELHGSSCFLYLSVCLENKCASYPANFVSRAKFYPFAFDLILLKKHPGMYLLQDLIKIETGLDTQPVTFIADILYSYSSSSTL